MLETENEIISKVVSILQSGGIVIFPTDTAFGIGCRMDSPNSVDRLFAIRKRPTNKATPVLVSSIDMALKYYDQLPDVAMKLMYEYWPGALTIVSKCKTELIPAKVRGQGDTIGLRMPNHLLVLEVIKSLGVPILGPSANFHGNKTPFSHPDLDPDLVRLVDYVIPGECSIKQISTVISCNLDTLTVLRQGALRVTNK
jgi:L-threonylcarbamoyladenylate synthase